MTKGSQILESRKFVFDNLDDYLYLKKLFLKANDAFLTRDIDLIKTDVSEPTLCSALKSRLETYLEKEGIADYFVDLEYNRNNGQIKTIIDDNLAIVKIKCDFILHSRGHNIAQDNLLALEMKKSYRSRYSKDKDRNRLIALTKSSYDNDVWSYDGTTMPEHVCRYIIGIYYEVDILHNKIILKFYRQGALEDRQVIAI